MRPLLLILTLALSVDAHGHDIDVDELSAISRQVDEQLEALDAERRNGGELVPHEERMRAYQDATASFLLGDHQEAALRFFVLRSLIDEPSLRAEVEWYLAQSLLLAGHDRLAEGVLRSITGLDGTEALHPFRDEAAALLLELTATRRPATDFAPLHDALDARGLVARSDTLAYSVGRSWYLAGQLGRARTQLEAIAPDHPVAPRAHYLLATLDLVEGRLDLAEAGFQSVADRSVDSAVDRHVVDLARLAVARIAFEQGRLDDAAERYARIDGTSPVLEDALYELAWTHIAREDDPAALRAVDLFLLAFPDAARAGRMTVARGHLQMRQGQWDEASWTYEGIDARFEGIEKELARLQVADLATLLEGTGPTGSLPGWVRERLVADEGLGRAVASQRSLDATALDLAEADVLATRLELELDGQVALKRHRRLRSGLFDAILRVGEAALQVVRLQLYGLGRDRAGRARARDLGPVADDVQDRLDQLRKRDTVRQGDRLARPEVLALSEEVWGLVRASRPDDDHHGVHTTVDELVGQLMRLQGDAHAQLDALDAEARDALVPIRDQLGRHQEELAQLHLAHAETSERTAGTRNAAIAAGVREVLVVLDDGVREARAGMADAAFAELQGLIADREALQVERDRLLEHLERTFAAARARL